MPTPILERFEVDSSTRYVFKDALQDLQSALADDNIQFTLSYFMALNIPDYEQNSLKNTLFDTRPTAVTDPNIGVPAQLQNYMENLVRHLNVVVPPTPYEGFDTMTEEAFWKWLGSTGAFHVKDDNGVYIEDTNSTVTNFVYENVIKYVGRMDVKASTKYQGETYTQFYVKIPESAGHIENVNFNLTTHPNWLNQNEITPDQYSFGLDASTVAPLGAESITDDGGVFDLTLNDIGTLSGAASHQICKTNGLKFDFSSFTSTTNNFDFNTILIYYDIYDKNDKTVFGRNLYGIMFIDEFEQDGATWRIPKFKKYARGNSSTANAYSHDLSSRLKNSTLSITPEQVLNEFSASSMKLYIDVLEKMLALEKRYEDAQFKLTSYSEKFANYDNLYSLLQLNSNLLDRVLVLEQIVAAYSSDTQDRISNTDILNLLTQILNNLNGTGVSQPINVTLNPALPTTLDHLGEVLHAGENETYYWSEITSTVTLYREWFINLIFQITFKMYAVGVSNSVPPFNPQSYFLTPQSGSVEDVALAINNFLPDFNALNITNNITSQDVFGGSYLDVTQEQTLRDAIENFINILNADVYSLNPINVNDVIVG